MQSFVLNHICYVPHHWTKYETLHTTHTHTHTHTHARARTQTLNGYLGDSLCHVNIVRQINGLRSLHMSLDIMLVTL
jgi:hypothetical protein